MSALGIEYKDPNHIKSPFRDDSNPSLSIFQHGNGWFFKDHGAGEHFKGDEIDFIRLYKNIGFKAALEEYQKLCGRFEHEDNTPYTGFRSQTNEEQFDWDKDLLDLTDAERHNFAVDRSYKTRLVDALHTAGLIGYSSKDNAISFPIQDSANGNYTGRHVWFKNRSPRFKTKGKAHPWWIGKSKAKQVHIFESQFDAFAFMQIMGWAETPDRFDDIAFLITRSASNTRRVQEYIRDEVSVYLHPQNDPQTEEGLTPAQKWTHSICKDLSRDNVYIVSCQREYKDMNDWLAGGATYDDVYAAISAAKPFKEDQGMAASGSGLPPIVNATTFIASPCIEPEQVIGGVLHKGGKLVIGGGSKGRKTWSLLQLACAVSTGGQWWGFNCHRGRALYVNFELADYAFHSRLRTIEEALTIAGRNNNLDVWNLRGHAADVKTVADMIKIHAGDRGYDMIVLDPIYKLLGDRDENSAGDMTDLMNTLESVAVEVNTAIVFGHHYAKGNTSEKFNVDRMSGSGVFARDPDAILNLGAHSEEDCYIVECTLRNFAPVDPFCLRWDFPLLDIDYDLDPTEHRQSTASRKRRWTFEEHIAPQIPSTGVSKTGLYFRTNEDSGITRTTFNRCFKEGLEANKVYEREDGVVLLK